MGREQDLLPDLSECLSMPFRLLRTPGNTRSLYIYQGLPSIALQPASAQTPRCPILKAQACSDLI